MCFRSGWALPGLPHLPRAQCTEVRTIDDFKSQLPWRTSQFGAHNLVMNFGHKSSFSSNMAVHCSFIHLSMCACIHLYPCLHLCIHPYHVYSCIYLATYYSFIYSASHKPHPFTHHPTYPAIYPSIIFTPIYSIIHHPSVHPSPYPSVHPPVYTSSVYPSPIIQQFLCSLMHLFISHPSPTHPSRRYSSVVAS